VIPLFPISYRFPKIAQKPALRYGGQFVGGEIEETRDGEAPGARPRRLEERVGIAHDIHGHPADLHVKGAWPASASPDVDSDLA
jgi:hypothetical protein